MLKLKGFSVKKIMMLLVISVFFFPGIARVQEHAAMVKSVSGGVDIQRQTAKIRAKKGMHLAKEDVVISSDSGYAGIMFTDGTVLTIGPKTEFRIDNYVFSPDIGEYDFSFYLAKGSAVYNSGKIGTLSPESVKITTPKATVGIRGTRFIIKVE
jgi:hypothetical protein